MMESWPLLTSLDTRETQRDGKPEEEEEGHARIKEEEAPIEINTGGSSNRNTRERCPRPLYSRDSTQQEDEIHEDDQDKNLLEIKVKEEVEETDLSSDEPCKEEEVPPEISTDDKIERDKDDDVISDYSEKDSISPTFYPEELSSDTSTNSEDLPNHNSSITDHKNHRGEDIFPCAECGMCFTQRAVVLG